MRQQLGVRTAQEKCVRSVYVCRVFDLELTSRQGEQREHSISRIYCIQVGRTLGCIRRCIRWPYLQRQIRSVYSALDYCSSVDGLQALNLSLSWNTHHTRRYLRRRRNLIPEMPPLTKVCRLAQCAASCSSFSRRRLHLLPGNPQSARKRGTFVIGGPQYVVPYATDPSITDAL